MTDITEHTIINVVNAILNSYTAHHLSPDPTNIDRQLMVVEMVKYYVEDLIKNSTIKGQLGRDAQGALFDIVGLIDYNTSIVDEYLEERSADMEYPL